MARYFRRILLLLMSLAFAVTASAQDWPMAKPLRIVIGYGPGSASDIFARLLGEQLSKSLGQTVIVESKSGAGGQIAAEYVARLPADGYTLFLTTNTTHSANPYLFKTLGYDPVKDFTPIARVGLFPFVLLVDAGSPIQTVQDLVNHAKAHPKTVSYAYTSSTGQVAAAALANSMKMNDAVAVPYKSSPEAMTSVLAGQTTFTVLDFASSRKLVQGGRLRAVAVTTNERTSLGPDLPTIAEASGLSDFGVLAWMGFFAPANLPAPIQERLSAELVKIVSAKPMQERIAAMGADPTPQGHAQFAPFVVDQLAVWKRQIGIAGMKPQ